MTKYILLYTYIVSDIIQFFKKEELILYSKQDNIEKFLLS